MAVPDGLVSNAERPARNPEPLTVTDTKPVTAPEVVTEVTAGAGSVK